MPAQLIRSFEMGAYRKKIIRVSHTCIRIAVLCSVFHGPVEAKVPGLIIHIHDEATTGTTYVYLHLSEMMLVISI